MRGACKVAYPVDRFRVLVLDDGKSSELQHEIQQLRKTWNQLHYHCRKKSMTQQNTFSKAKNLNYALFEIQEPMKQPPEFVAIFDADFIPSPDFLRATLPHLLRSPKLAIAGACQDFYNIPKDDPLAQSLDNWQRKLVPHLNQLGSCFHAHSGSVIRRSTLMQCQGFPNISYNEDVLLSFILLGSGSHIISLPEMLQLGRCPESLQGHISQRTRWAIGLTQMMLARKPTSNNTVPPHFRKGIFNFGLTVVFSLINRTLVQVILPLALWSGQTLIPGPCPLYWKIQTLLAIIYLGLIWSFELSLTAKTSSGGPPFGDMEEIWLAPSKDSLQYILASINRPISNKHINDRVSCGNIHALFLAAAIWGILSNWQHAQPVEQNQNYNSTCSLKERFLGRRCLYQCAQLRYYVWCPDKCSVIQRKELREYRLRTSLAARPTSQLSGDYIQLDASRLCLGTTCMD